MVDRFLGTLKDASPREAGMATAGQLTSAFTLHSRSTLIDCRPLWYRSPHALQRLLQEGTKPMRPAKVRS